MVHIAFSSGDTPNRANEKIYNGKTWKLGPDKKKLIMTSSIDKVKEINHAEMSAGSSSGIIIFLNSVYSVAPRSFAA